MDDINEHSSSIDVGRTKPTGKVFIGVPESRTERIQSGIRKRKKIAIDLTEDDVVWLIYALAKELGPSATSLIGNNLAKCGFCCQCGDDPAQVELEDGIAVSFCDKCW